MDLNRRKEKQENNVNFVSTEAIVRLTGAFLMLLERA